MSEKLTTADFVEKTKEGVSIVKFEASWCGPCKAMTEVLNQVEKDSAGTKFFTVDADAETELVNKFGIRGIPFTLKIENGEASNSIIGVQTVERMKQFVILGPEEFSGQN